MVLFTSLLIALAPITALPVEGNSYKWLNHFVTSTIENTYTPPQGYIRQPVIEASFADWIRKLPLKAKGSKVIKYNGKPLWYQHHANRIIDIDVGKRDLMQCADFLLRLKAEYAFTTNKTDDLAFHFTSGDLYSFNSWLSGTRPIVKGNSVNWKKTHATQKSHDALREWLQVIYTYAGTVSLTTETKPVKSPKDIQIGDILLEPGFPGHTMIVADLAKNDTGKILALFIEGSTPAQSPHVVNGTFFSRTKEWHPIESDREIETAIWTFNPEHLRRFK